MNAFLLTDILKMLPYGLGNIYLTDRSAIGFRQDKCIALGALCGAEAWHGHGDYALAVK